MPTIPGKYLLLLLAFSVPLFFMSINDKHSWGDDFSQYIKEAQNIGNFKPYYQSGNIYNKYNYEYAPPQYPPGFPLLLAPIVKIWGLSYRAMFYFNSLLVACLLFASFIFFRRKDIDPFPSLCLSLLIAYNAQVLDLKGSVLADVPCLLFVTLYFAFRDTTQWSWKRIGLLILFAVMAIQTRSQAIFLLAAEAVFFVVLVLKTVITERNLPLKKLISDPSLAVIAGTLLVNFILAKTIFYTPLAASAFYNEIIKTALKGDVVRYAQNNFHYMLDAISDYFSYRNYNGFLDAAMYLARQTALGFCFTGFVLAIIKRLSPEDFFFLGMCAVILFFPAHDVRYFLPALTILIYYCYLTVAIVARAISEKRRNIVIGVFTAGYLVLGYSYMKSLVTTRPTGCIPEPNDLQAFRYVSQHVNDSDVIVFAKPRVLALYTGKKTFSETWQVPDSVNKDIFASVHVRYILIRDGLGDAFFHRYLNNVQHPVDSVHIADAYTLYSLR